jgi:glycosyltransferase involved in cell wall biosynthesis
MASKGFFYLARAIQILNKNKNYNIRLIVLGQCIGDELMDLKKCRKELNFFSKKSWFFYHGKVGRKELIRFLYESEIVCLPSTYSSECQPLALIEAMCTYREILIADTPALNSTVGDYPCIKISLPITTDKIVNEISIALQNKSESDNNLYQAGIKAQERFSPIKFDLRISKILNLGQI